MMNGNLAVVDYIFGRFVTFIFFNLKYARLFYNRTHFLIVQELFSGSCIPSMEGPLYVKSDSKKGWKRHHCILRASGLYYLPKDKVKTSYKDLVCLATFDVNQVSI